MQNQIDREYFRRRAAQEREAAMKTGSSARVIHADLAARYTQLAEGDAPAEPKRSMIRN
jgi:hypothetical protein